MTNGLNLAMVEIRSLGERPPTRGLAFSLLAHCFALLLLLAIRFPTSPRISPNQFHLAQVIPPRTHVAFAPMRTAIPGEGGRNGVRSRSLTVKPHSSALQLSAGEALQKEAKQYSAAMMNSLKFQEIYGFYPGHKFQLPLRQSGEIPHISRDQVPPHYEQIVLIDVTIDTEGKVADARIVAGLVDPAIQQILLTAVREFKYSPATRDDIPIPSQVEIVVPVPS